MKKIVLLFALLLIATPATNVFAYSWYWGADPGSDYVADHALGESWIALPFTVVPDGYEWVGASQPVVYYTGNGAPGHWVYANSTPYLYPSVPKITSTTYIPDMYFLTGYLPEGSYTDDGAQGYSGRLGFQAIGSFTLDEVYSSNNFTVRIGDALQPSVVPEPASLSFLGLGLSGLLFRRKRIA